MDEINIARIKVKRKAQKPIKVYTVHAGAILEVNGHCPAGVLVLYSLNGRVVSAVAKWRYKEERLRFVIVHQLLPTERDGTIIITVERANGNPMGSSVPRYKNYINSIVDHGVYRWHATSANKHKTVIFPINYSL